MKGRRGWDMEFINVSARLDDAGGRYNIWKHCIKKLCSGFLIRKVPSKVTVCSEYHIMPGIRRNAYQQMLEFNGGRFVTYSEYGLSFHDIARHTGRHPSTIKQKWNQWGSSGS